MKRLLKPTSLFVVIATCLAGVSLHAVEVPAEIRGFEPVRGGDRINQGFRIYVSSHDAIAFASHNPTDLVVLENFTALQRVPSEEGGMRNDTYLFSFDYSGLNTATMVEQDKGVMIMEVGLRNIDLFASHTVGFFRKTGPWVVEGSNPEGLLDSLSGTVEYTDLDRTRELQYRFRGEFEGLPLVLEGPVVAQVLSTEAVSYSDWYTTGNSTQYHIFRSGVLNRTGIHYETLLQRTDSYEPDHWTSRYALLRITDPNDSSDDGVPDFSSLGAEQVLGILTTNSLKLGDFHYFSSDLNTTIVHDPKQLWLYGENLGWFYLPDQSDSGKIRLYIPDDRLGWLWTHSKMSPDYIRESDGARLRFEKVDGVVRYYDSSTDAWYTPQY